MTSKWEDDKILTTYIGNILLSLQMNIRVLIIHAKKYAMRKCHMDSMMRVHPYSFEYILDGDANQLSKELIYKYFTDEEIEKGVKMDDPCILSCALKHFYAYEKIVKEKLSGALILEDDAILFDSFDVIFAKTMQEYEDKYKNDNVIISYEDTRLRFIPRSKRVKGTYLYRGDRDRMAGAYYINKNAAEMILYEVKSKKCHLPIDLYHRHLINQGKLLYLWCQPTIATQGSHTGLFSSTLSGKDLWMKNLRWKCKLIYKKLLYEFR